MMNAGKFNHKIEIYSVTVTYDSQGYKTETLTKVLTAYAHVKTTRGFTLIANGSDFEKAYTNFTIRKPNAVITRDMIIMYRDKTYTIEYLNNVDEEDIELEIQAKEVTH